MPSELLVGSIVGFAFVLIAGTWLGTDPDTVFGGLFAAQGVRDWPSGVQEPDAPRFAVDHLDALQREGSGPYGEDEPTPELIELGERRLGRGR
jgi:hypothetical protein